MKIEFLLQSSNQAADVPSLSSQKSCESNVGVATSAGHHLYALLCESGGGRHLTNRFHLFQLLSTVFSGEEKNNDTVRLLASARKPTHTVYEANNMNHTDFVTLSTAAEFFQDDFLGQKPFCGKMIRTSILAMLAHSPPSCLMLSALSCQDQKPCGHDSVFNCSFYFFICA